MTEQENPKKEKWENCYCPYHKRIRAGEVPDLPDIHNPLINHPSVGGIMDFTVKTKEPPAPKGRTNPLSPDYPHY